MQRFKTLLWREWMQHRIGWLAMMTVPFVLLLLAVSFGNLHVNLADADVNIRVAGQRLPLNEGLLPLGISVFGGTAFLTVLLVWMGNMIQAPGLARRDQQDRSIEFWLSLPASHVQSLGATLLMHLLLVPAAAMLVGLLGGAVIAVMLLIRVDGFTALAALPWLAIAPATLAALLRALFGLMLATLWLSPMVLGTMAASAWLKRWGLPAVIGGLTVAHTMLKNGYGITLIADTIGGWFQQAQLALVGAGGRGNLPGVGHAGEFEFALRAFPSWAAGDAAAAVANLATPAFALAMVIAAAAFGLLILRRQRGA